MTRRAAFLASTPAFGWAEEAMAGDASSRQFTRLTGSGGQSAILMEVPPASGEDLAPFLHLARHLRGAGLTAPAILAADAQAGFALVEDLGPDHLTAHLARHPDAAPELYAAATDVLIRLQSVTPPDGLTALTPERGAAMIAPLFDHYCRKSDPRWQADVIGFLQAALTAHAPLAETLSLRDFHAENLIWRPEHAGTDRIGLVDFQDAVLAPPEYDLASLLRDVRRDVDRDLAQAMARRFATATGRPIAQVTAACATLAVQRNLRILGIFVRLARQNGKRRYLDFLPRLWRLLQEDLDHPALAALAPVIRAGLPAPALAGAAP